MKEEQRPRLIIPTLLLRRRWTMYRVIIAVILGFLIGIAGNFQGESTKVVRIESEPVIVEVPRPCPCGSPENLKATLLLGLLKEGARVLESAPQAFPPAILKARSCELEEQLAFWHRYAFPLEDKKYGYSSFLKGTGRRDTLSSELAFEIITEVQRISWSRVPAEKIDEIDSKVSGLYRALKAVEMERDAILNTREGSRQCEFAGVRERFHAAQDAVAITLFEIFGKNSPCMKNMRDPRELKEE